MLGIHDWSPEWGAIVREVGASAWCVQSEEVYGPGKDYRPLADYGVVSLVRLNHSHSGFGTLPLPRYYRDFAQACAAFVRTSQGCNHWIVGNEPNWSVEWPSGVVITPENYAEAFNLAASAIRSVSPTAQVISAAIAPYNVESGFWLDYYAVMLGLLERPDGIALHTYSRGASPESVTSEARMDAPFSSYRNGFRAYRDFIPVIPHRFRNLPIYITETNQMAPWQATGWIEAALSEIALWNKTSSPKISCLTLYRWEAYDEFGFKNKPAVVEEFKMALREWLPEREQEKPVADRAGLEWDERLDARGVRLHPASVQPGAVYWKLVKAKWLDRDEARKFGPDHHILIESLDEQGRRLTGSIFRIQWPSGASTVMTKGNQGYPWAGDYSMSKSLNEYSIEGIEFPSDRVGGIGMGKDGNPAEHTSTLLVFQKQVAGESKDALTVTVPAGANIRTGPGLGYPVLGAVPVGASLPVLDRHRELPWWKVQSPWGDGWVSASVFSSGPPSPPADEASNWERSIRFVLRWEGGLVDHPADPGGLTNFGISQSSYPNLDIRNLTQEQAKEIYYRDYWMKSGADTLPWPICLAHFDLAVNGGLGRAVEAMRETGGNFSRYMAWRLDWYTRIDNFAVFGKAWVRRCADLIRESVGG